MGGTRCYFRNCQVSTNHYPRMHCFHFPIKNKERYMQWLEMATCKYFLDMPLVFQKNRMVCARHFRDECFMNYKKDRLISGKAVPTLMRLTKTTALDYAKLDETGMPTLVTLEPPKEPHLIPPPDYQCTLYLDRLEFENQVAEAASVKETEQKSNKANESADNINKRLSRKRVTNNGNSKILNKRKVPSSRTLNAVYSMENDQLVVKDSTSTCEPLPEMLETELEEQLEDTDEEEKTSELDEVSENQEQTMSGKSPQHNQSNEVTIVDIDEVEVVSKKDYETVCQLLEQVLESERETHTREKAKLTAQLQAAQLAVNEATEHKARSQKYVELQNKYAELEKKLVEQQKLAAEAASTSKETKPANAQGSAAAQPPATKAQLFNGIKKYLCASMVALVRMEMFGHEEREWKPDERRVALDLLAQGEDVYRFVSDEWRCRLPTLRQVRAWQNEDAVAENEEDEL